MKEVPLPTTGAQNSEPTQTRQEPIVLKDAQWEVPKSILFTMTAQGDFLMTLTHGQTAPTIVHVGSREAERLCGPAGSLVEFLVLASKSDPRDVAIVHVCDDHDPARDAAHLARFGTHAIRNTKGAELIGGLEQLSVPRENTYRVHAGGLNDLHDTQIVRLLKDLLEGRDLRGVKVAVVGVWTNVKVQYLIRDLITELGADNVATCSSLTASNVIENHFNALQHLQDVLGVKVFHSHLDLLNWLNPNAQVELPPPTKGKISYASADGYPGLFSPSQIAERNALISTCLDRVEPGAEWSLKALGGGFSGSQVFIARSENKVVVAKIGARAEAAHERFANERMARRVRGHVPAVLAYCEGPTMASMVQALAAPKSERVQGPLTFQELAQKNHDEDTTELLQNALAITFDRALGGSILTASLGTSDLLRDCAFTDERGNARWAKSVCASAGKIYGKSGFDSAESFFRFLRIPEPWCSPQEFYNQWLPGKTMIRETLQTVVHGDLNLVNILLSRESGNPNPENVWVIDWARLSQLPVLTDFAKVENDLSYIVLPITNIEELQRALKMQEIRLRGPTLEVSGMEEIAQTPAEKRYVRLITQLRSLAAQADDRGGEAMEAYRVSLLRYAAHTMGFSEPNHAQRALALCACGRLAGLIRADVEGKED